MAQLENAAQPIHSLSIFISTGEVSGDLQGSFLIKALHSQARQQGIALHIYALGGPRMAAAGATLVGNTTAIGSVGLFEALPYVWPTLKVQRHLKRQLPGMDLDLVIFIDYMNPNLNLGNYLRQSYSQIPTAYYIAPQQWVWTFSQQESQDIANISDQMVAVFPQEAEYYRTFGADVSYFGHPLVDEFPVLPDISYARQQLGVLPERPVITLLPASRAQEVKYVLPLLLAVAEQLHRELPTVQFLMPLSRATLRSAIEAEVARSSLDIQLIEDNTRTAIAAADLVLNKSGTVNLEVALMNVPQVVVYRLNPLTARIAYHLLKLRVSYVSPVNLFLNKPVVPEFIQWEATVPAIAAASSKLLKDIDARTKMQNGYRELRQAMGEPGVCDRAAKHLLSFACDRYSSIHQPE